METDRPDAHFRDPYARLLADTRGQQLMERLPNRAMTASSCIVRSCLMDKLILQSIAGDAIDTVVHLGAGLDTRPYRLPFPASLTWIEVDLPDVLAYKARKLKSHHPACALEAVQVDLTNADAVQALFACVGRTAKRVLIVSEGLLVFLTQGQVAALACDLYTRSQICFWLSDIVSATALRLMGHTLAPSVQGRDITLRFAPEEGPAFFQPYGWDTTEFHSLVEESWRLNRWFLPATLLFTNLSAVQRQVLHRLFAVIKLGRTHR
jgi:methyltransferase (TIGR00027 family)